MYPTTRVEGVLIQELGEELVVYDQVRHTAHRLTLTAALVYRHCDGKTTIGELAALAGDAELVEETLAELAAAGLLREPVVSRRVMGRRLVESLLAPLPAAAYTW